jgi:hypothetical protein
VKSSAFRSDCVRVHASNPNSIAPEYTCLSANAISIVRRSQERDQRTDRHCVDVQHGMSRLGDIGGVQTVVVGYVAVIVHLQLAQEVDERSGKYLE